MIWFGFRCLQISDFRSECCWWCITFWIVLWLFTEQNFYQGVFRFSSVQSVLATAETAFQARTESDRHRRGDRSRTPAKIQWSQIRGAHCFEHIIVANILIIPPPSSRRAQADSRRRADAHTQGDFPCVPTCRETWYMDFCKHRSWRRFLQEAPRLRSRAVILQVCNLWNNILFILWQLSSLFSGLSRSSWRSPIESILLTDTTKTNRLWWRMPLASFFQWMPGRFANSFSAIMQIMVPISEIIVQ